MAKEAGASGELRKRIDTATHWLDDQKFSTTDGRNARVVVIGPQGHHPGSQIGRLLREYAQKRVGISSCALADDIEEAGKGCDFHWWLFEICSSGWSDLSKGQLSFPVDDESLALMNQDEIERGKALSKKIATLSHDDAIKLIGDTIEGDRAQDWCSSKPIKLDDCLFMLGAKD